MLKNNSNLLLIIIFLTISFFSLVFIKNFSPRGAQHFIAMAYGFMEKRLDLPYLDPDYGDLDTNFHNGKFFWTEPPFSGIVLVPFVFLSDLFQLPLYQGYLQFFITLGIFFVCYKLAKIKGQNKVNSLFLAFAFCFSSIYSFVSLFSESWYFSQSLSVLLLLLSLYEWFTKRRLIIVGLLLSCLILTRTTTIFSAVFFIMSLLFEKGSDQIKKISNILTLTIPIVVSVLLIFGYNQARFGNIFTTGHATNNVQPQMQALMRDRYGLFKVSNIPSNFYWYFLSFPQPVTEPDTYHLIFPFFQTDGWGMSFFIMSPLFLLILKTIKKGSSKENIFIWISSTMTLLLLLMWHSTGFFQIGPRYLLDLLPLWFILLLNVLSKENIKPIHYAVIIISSLTNLFWILPYLS